MPAPERQRRGRRFDRALDGHAEERRSGHAAFFSLEAEKELRRKAAQNIVSWIASGKPDYVVTRGTRAP